MTVVGSEQFRTPDGRYFVRIMPEFASEGVWDFDGAEAVLEDLPIPPALCDRLAAWQAVYDELDDQASESDLPFGGPDMLSAWRAFADDGLAIAKAVKQALPEWTVVYFDEASAIENRYRGLRSAYEYEIALP